MERFRYFNKQKYLNQELFLLRKIKNLNAKNKYSGLNKGETNMKEQVEWFNEPRWTWKKLLRKSFYYKLVQGDTNHLSNSFHPSKNT